MASKARNILQKDRDFIHWLFDNQCVICGSPTSIIHEIVPISHGRKTYNWRNRVMLCLSHHNWAHDIGTKNSIPILEHKRKEFLVRRFS